MNNPSRFYGRLNAIQFQIGQHEITISTLFMIMRDLIDEAEQQTITAESKLADQTLEIANLKTALEDSQDDLKMITTRLSESANHVHILESKLAELESKVSEPIYEIKLGGGWISVEKDRWEIEADWYRRVVYAHPKPQRITEQDAREIALNAVLHYSNEYGIDLDKWLDVEGRTLLAELNEHREPEAKLESSIDRELLPCPCCGSRAEFDHDDQGYEWVFCTKCSIATDTAISGMIDAKGELSATWNKRSQVTANKAEVPEEWPTAQMIVRGCESFYDVMLANGISLGNDEQDAKFQELVVETIFDSMIDAAPLPPLKDDTKMKCKGTNCSAVNSNIHSLECRAEHDALVYSGAGNRHPTARYMGYKGEPLKSGASADEHAAWMEGDAARTKPLKDGAQ
jgi:hypothetical protein